MFCRPKALVMYGLVKVLKRSTVNYNLRHGGGSGPLESAFQCPHLQSWAYLKRI